MATTTPTQPSTSPYGDARTAAVRIVEEPADTDAAIRLRAAARLERDALTHEHATEPSALVLSTLAAHFVARDQHAAPLGCIGMAPVGEGAFEILGFWVRSDARGRGVGAALLAAVEAAARVLQAPALVHESSPQLGAAIAFLLHHGYEEIAPWRRSDEDRAEVHLGKMLS